MSLRTISDDTFSILDVKRENAVIANVDAISALELVYPEAIYLHEGDTYFVKKLDMEQKVAKLEFQFLQVAVVLLDPLENREFDPADRLG